MDQRILGRAYSRPAKNYVLETRPGYRLQFFGGQAILTTEADVLACLRRENMIVELREWHDSLPGWIEKCGWQNPAKAIVDLPSGMFRVVTSTASNMDFEYVLFPCTLDGSPRQVEPEPKPAPKNKGGRPRKVKEPVVTTTADPWTLDEVPQTVSV